MTVVSKGTGGTYRRCYHDHPALKVGKFKIYGGSCIDPEIKDADVYVGFDGGMRFQPGYPWDGMIQALFKIQDMGVPSSVPDTERMVAFLQEALEMGKKVHIGCIGGHGRTGMILSILVSRMMPEVESPTDYVRENYCKKAVESAHQVQWLHQHFGIKKVKGAKEGLNSNLKRPKSQGYKQSGFSFGGQIEPTSKKAPPPKGSDSPRSNSDPQPGKYATDITIHSIPGVESIWFKPKGLTPHVQKIQSSQKP